MTRFVDFEKAEGASLQSMQVIASGGKPVSEMDKADLLTVDQTARKLGIKPRTVWKYVYERQIDSVLIGRLRRIRLKVVDELIERNTVKAIR